MRPSPRTALVLALAALLPLSASAREAAAVRAEPTWADLEVRRLERDLTRDLSRPRALVDLSSLSAIIDDVTDLPRLRSAFLKAAWSRRAHGEVRAYARWDLARVEWRRGRRPQAERWIGTLGMARTGAFVGPFDNEGGAGYDAVYGPETDEAKGVRPDPEKTFDGKEHPVRWRALPDTSPLGWVDLGPLVSPAQEVVVYVRLTLDSARGGPAYLRLGSPGATKVWVGGRLVHEDPADHPARFDQTAIPVQLPAGRTPVLLKLTQREGALRYYLRITDRDGDRLRGVRVLDPDLGGAPAEPAAKAPAHPRPVPPADTVLARLEKRAAARPDDPEARFALAHALAVRAPFDRTARRAVTEARAAAEATDAVGEAAARRWYLVSILEDDANRRRMALEHAVAADPDLVEAQVALARHDLARELPARPCRT